jgi:hypothetical protein
LSFHLRLGFPDDLFLSYFPVKIYMIFPFPCMLLALPISSYVIWLLKQCITRRINYEVSLYRIFSNLLSFHPSYVEIFSSALCSQNPWLYVLPLM